MRTFQVANVHCEKCAGAIKGSLEDEFGEIIVNLEVEPKTISLEVSDDKLDYLKSELDDLGFGIIKEVK